MKVSWDDYSQYIGKIKNVPNHQPDGDNEDALQSNFIDTQNWMDFRTHIPIINNYTLVEWLVKLYTII